MPYAYKVLRQTINGNLRSITTAFSAMNYGRGWVKSTAGELFVFGDLGNAKHFAIEWQSKMPYWVFYCETTELHKTELGIYLKPMEKMPNPREALKRYWNKEGLVVNVDRYACGFPSPYWEWSDKSKMTEMFHLPVGTYTCESIRLIRPISMVNQTVTNFDKEQDDLQDLYLKSINWSKETWQQ